MSTAVQLRRMQDAFVAIADFDESKHPRDNKGRFGPGGRTSTLDIEDEVDTMSQDLRSMFRGLTLDVHFDSGGDGSLILSRIAVPKEARGTGIGTKVLRQLADFADSKRLKIELSPEPLFGGSKAKLVDFYKRFDFVENKGRNKDFTLSETMYRLPK